ncbi:MAG: DUF4347 domain-containing protein [Kofleriaceae bacterium]
MRALIYDRTCTDRGGGLSRVWSAGSTLYRGLRRVDAVRGVASWDEALAWLGSIEQPIAEVQYWGHGKWGSALVADDVLDVSSLTTRRAALEAVRERLAPDALVWFRTCETFGAEPGIDFAERLADFLGARVAGHTHLIGFHQSGLHGLHPGVRANWSPDEGLAEGTTRSPTRARRSAPWLPRTVTCLAGSVPERWFSR